MKFKIVNVEIIDGVVDLPEDAVPLKVCLMLTGKLMDDDTKMVDGISCLIPLVD